MRRRPDLPGVAGNWRATVVGLLRLERGTDPRQFTLKLIAVALYGTALLLWAVASYGAG